jgi:hypothetical protein
MQLGVAATFLAASETTVWSVAAVGPEGGPHPVSRPTRLTGSDARRLHLTLFGGLALCVGAFAIELVRALGGHSFSWLYVIEWPLFAGFGIYVWWTLLHGRDRVPREKSKEPNAGPRSETDEDLDAWNLYLQVMEAEEEQGPGRPGS